MLMSGWPYKHVRKTVVNVAVTHHDALESRVKRDNERSRKGENKKGNIMNSLARKALVHTL